jgi:hypothetical protein
MCPTSLPWVPLGSTFERDALQHNETSKCAREHRYGTHAHNMYTEADPTQLSWRVYRELIFLGNDDVIKTATRE